MGERDHYLHGAEDVRSAANTMSHAADRMNSAANTISSAADHMANIVEQNRFDTEAWLQRFEAAVEKLRPDPSLGAPEYPRPGHKPSCTADRCHCGSQ